ncbi:MAG: FKBP-type peptidyl-prolyl cis-trans isomerase [Bacteroidetes bacterium]|nr:FKBP-type peptidyl-prolyl cis-trans isomerase [Bacteroidota bacterium]
MKSKLGFLFALLAVVAFTGCSKYPGFDKTDSGLYYKFHVKNDGAQKPAAGDYIMVEMAYRIDTMKLFDSKKNGEPVLLQIVEPLYKGDIVEGLKLMGIGDSATFIINTDSFFLKNVGLEKLPPKIKGGTVMHFDFKLISIKKKAEFEKEQQAKMEEQKIMMEKRKESEPIELAKYIKDNKINAKPTKSGLYYIELKKGTGAKAENGKTVSVHYTGFFLDGSKFESSLDRGTPIDFPLGQKNVIPGWEEGISMMKVGGKAKLIIPSELAYGPQGKQPIMPYTPLVFEVELVGVK